MVAETFGSALNGDQSSTLQYVVTFSSQHGMVWVGLDAAHGYKDHGDNRLGCQLGVLAQTTSNVPKKNGFGRRVAELLIKLNH